MNTKINCWIKPHRRSLKSKKEYYSLIVDKIVATTGDAENILEENIEGIMNYAFVDINDDFEVIGIELTDEPIGITQIEKPKKTRKLNGVLTKECISVDNGIISIKQKGLKDSINFPELWDSLEKYVAPNFKEGDTAVLTDDDGNTLFEIMGGSYLNVGLADLKIYDKEGWQTGGVFIRDNGDLCIGNTERTFYVHVYTSKLMLAALKAESKISTFFDKINGLKSLKNN